MNKQVKRNLATFQAAQRRSARYHVSQYTLHDQAIREHITRGFQDPRRHRALDELVLLDKANRI